MKYYVHISMTYNYLIFDRPYIQLFISISQLSYPKYCELWNWNVLQNDTCLFTLWFVPIPKTKVVWREGPFLVCHSTLIQYLVVHNYKPKNSLQNFTSFVQRCGNNIQCYNLQQTCKPWKNSKALNLFWSITTTQHKKKYNKKASNKKNKRTKKWFTLEQPNHPTLHILGEQLGARLRLHLLSHSKSIWIWPPFHNFVQKKVLVKQPPHTHYFQNWCDKVLLFSWKTNLQSHCFQTYNFELIFATPIPLKSIYDADV